MKTVKKVGLFTREDERSKEIETQIKTELLKNGFEVAKSDIDMGIAIGGDGTFLRMVKETSFKSDILYVGINTGTLGFLQEIGADKYDLFIQEILGGYYKIEDVGIQEISVVHKNGVSRFCSLNEIIIRDKDLKVVRLDIKVGESLFEHFIGDGVLIASTLGSTAHNLSFGGAIVYNTLPTLQITPIGPINSKVYKTIPNSFIVPEHVNISLDAVDETKSLVLTIDGENNFFDMVSKIEASIGSKRIKCIRLSEYDLPKKINEKLLTK